MGKLIITGCGAAPGVPAVASGWGNCNPNNPKNVRRRSGAYLEIGDARILIDSSPDLHAQLVDNNIRYLDAVLYTHAHADHLHGIDDLRDINRISRQALDVYANDDTYRAIKERFPYLVVDDEMPNNPLYKASLILHHIIPGESFEIKGVKITPLLLAGHSLPSVGYMFEDGAVVYISDCKEIPAESLALICRRPQILVMPLTTPRTLVYHMGLETLLGYVDLLKPEIAVVNHMAVECDYDAVDEMTPQGVVPAFDNMVLSFDERKK